MGSHAKGKILYVQGGYASLNLSLPIGLPVTYHEFLRELQRKNDPYKTQKCCGGRSPPQHFWVQLFCVSPL